MSDFREPRGERVGIADLRSTRGRAVAELLSAERLPYVRLLEVRRSANVADVVVFEVEPEVPQHPVVDIRKVERIAAVFVDDGSELPATLALRLDFPHVPHMNLVTVDELPSLCLFEQAYEELRDQWTAAFYLRRVHEWLSLASQGKLHPDDQPLEPFLLPFAPIVIIPSDLFSDGTERVEDLEAVVISDTKETYVVRRTRSTDTGSGKPQLKALAISCRPHVHGLIQHRPATLEELHTMLEAAGRDLRAELRDYLRRWRDEQSIGPSTVLLILVFVPLKRTINGEVERIDPWAFIAGPFAKDVGERLGLWEVSGDQLLPLVVPGELPGEDIPIEVLRPVRALSRQAAAHLNGVAPTTIRVAAVGLGALGSQVVENLARTGFGEWDLIDDDVLLPHNCARHALHPAVVGFTKVRALAAILNDLFEGEPIARAIPESVLQSSGAVDESFAGADLILDMSASVPVARCIAIDSAAAARRLSLFLNPDGADLVLLAEDPKRQFRLDDLEMQYYRAVLHQPDLDRHLRPAGKRIRYGQSCRDVSAAMPQDAVATFAGIGARAVRRAVESGTADIRIWRTERDGVAPNAIPVEDVHVLQAGEWAIRTDAGVARKLADMRASKLPNETGGVLIGRHDLRRRILYMVDALPAPPDSEEWPVAYVRGSKDLTAHIEEIQSRTGNMITYVGEWHSHPRGCPAIPSQDDCLVALWIAEHMDIEELPAFMAIVGDDGPAYYLAEVVRRDPALAVTLVQGLSHADRDL